METEPQNDRRPTGTIWAVALLVVGALVLTALVSVNRGEPSIRGRKLTGWIEMLMVAPADSPVRVEAKQAVLDIGVDGIPYLLFCLEGKATLRDKAAEILMSKGYTRPAGWLIGNLHLASRPVYAVNGFMVLGTNAVSALPRLIDLQRTVPIENSGSIAIAMAFLGRAGQLELLSRFPSPAKAYPIGSNESARSIDCVQAFASLNHFEPEVLSAINQYASSSDFIRRTMALKSVLNLRGNLDLKRSLLDWSFKSAWNPQYWDAFRLLENNPELVPEFRERIAGLPAISDPYSKAVQVRLLKLPKTGGH